jgi:aryl sulfotransferase
MRMPQGWVWIASYPKSGNTWMRVLLANLMSSRDEPRNINNLDDPVNIVSRPAFENAAMVDTTLLHQSELDRIRPAVHDFTARGLRAAQVIKTHDQGVRADHLAVLGSAGRVAIYLLRDPRDVAVSYAHHMSLNLDKAIAHMASKTHWLGAGRVLPHVIGDWGSHVKSWTEQDRIPVFALRYEDLLADTLGGLTKVAAFLGIECDAQALEMAVAHSRFEELRRQEELYDFSERQPGQKRFFREGRAGQWREVLTPEQVQAIEAAHGEVMRRWGYELSQPDVLAD